MKRRLQVIIRGLWKNIYEANKELIKNPDLIYPGMTLVMPASN